MRGVISFGFGVLFLAFGLAKLDSATARTYSVLRTPSPVPELGGCTRTCPGYIELEMIQDRPTRRVSALI